jgi:hypothetical protein
MSRNVRLRACGDRLRKQDWLVLRSKYYMVAITFRGAVAARRRVRKAFELYNMDSHNHE